MSVSDFVLQQLHHRYRDSGSLLRRPLGCHGVPVESHRGEKLPTVRHYFYVYEHLPRVRLRYVARRIIECRNWFGGVVLDVKCCLFLTRFSDLSSL